MFQWLLIQYYIFFLFSVDRCKDCDEHAHCVLGHCICNPGYIGNGYECKEDGKSATFKQRRFNVRTEFLSYLS